MIDYIMATAPPELWNWIPGDGLGKLIGLVLIILIGYQGRGFILAFREDKRKEAADDVDLLEEVKKITRDELRSMSDELKAERRERQKLSRRVTQLERTLISNGIQIPPCDV